MRPWASAFAEPLSVAPGEEVSADVTVRNVSDVVDEFRLEVAGAAAAWADVRPPSLRLYPGAQGKAKVSFRPPRLPSTSAGDVAVTLRVLASEDPGSPLVLGTTLRVGGYKSLSASVTPETSTARRSAVHVVTVENQGNLPANATISPSGSDQKLNITAAPAVLAVPNGGRGTSQLAVTSRKRLIRGRPVTHRFRIAVTEAGSPPLSLDAAIEQTPLLSGCFGRFLFLILLALAVIGAAFIVLIVVLRG